MGRLIPGHRKPSHLYYISLFLFSLTTISCTTSPFAPPSPDISDLRFTDNKATREDSSEPADGESYYEPKQNQMASSPGVEEIREAATAIGADLANTCVRLFESLTEADETVWAKTLDILKSAERQHFFAQCEDSLGIRLDGTENRDLLETIREWIGTRYQFGGCAKGVGVDCSCLVKLIYETVYEIELKRNSRAMFASLVKKVSKDELREGDLVFFKTSKKYHISHVGLYLKDNYFVHASQSHGVVLSSLKNNYFRKRFVQGARVLNNPVNPKKSIQVAARRKK